MKYFGIIALLLLSISCSSSPTNKAKEDSATTVKTIYLVRHAEKDLTDTTGNPLLTREGKIRADKLKNILLEKGIETIYSTHYERNMNTVRPLANALELPIQNYRWTQWQSMVDSIQASDKETFLICGHGDNILPMIRALGAKPPLEKLQKHEYDKLFIVTLGDTTLVQMKTY